MIRKLNSKEVARMFGVDRSTVTYWAREGILPGEKKEFPVSEGGDQYRFDVKDVFKLLQDRLKKYSDDLQTLQKRITAIEKAINELAEVIKQP